MRSATGLEAAEPGRRTVSVIVPHYSDLTRLDICLTALGTQTYPRENLEIIVVDNNSPEGEAAIEQVIGGRAKLVVVRERGAGPARNGGVAIAAGEILAFTDSDCIPQADWLSQGVEALERHDFVGGRMTVLVGDEARMSAAEAFERIFAFDVERYVREKGFAVTANLFCPREIHDRVGPFRVGVSEDLEWSQRAGSMGYRLGYAPLAVVGHPARRDWAELWNKWRRLNAETYSLYTERKAGRLQWLARSLLLPLSALAHMPKVFASPNLSRCDQRLAAAGTLVRLRIRRMIDAIRLAAGKGNSH